MWLLVGLPSWRDLPRVRQELAERRGQLEAWSNPSRGAGEQQERERKLAEAAAALRRVGAPAGGALEVIVGLERAAEARGVTQRLQLGDPEPIGRSSWQRSQVNLEAIGRFGDVAAFVDDLRRLPWLLDVTQIGIRRDAEGNVRAALAGTLLWQPSQP